MQTVQPGYGVGRMKRLLLAGGACLPFCVLVAGGGEVRAPAVAGTFYERSPFVLDRQVQDLLMQGAGTGTAGRAVAAVVPHAGYEYSGQTAARFYTLLSSGQVDRVIILGPAHHALVRGVALPDTALTDYYTPLGLVPIDQAACAALKDHKEFVSQPAAAVREHSIEVQLPFLQKTLLNFRIIPLLCGPPGEVDVEAVGAALAPLLDSHTLVIASSDFTHYGASYGFTPFTNEVRSHLESWLEESSAQVAARDEAGFVKHCGDTGDTICGEVPIRILLAALRLAGQPVKGRLLAHALSSDRGHDQAHSVSYAAIGFFSGAEPRAGSCETGRQEEHPVKEHQSGAWTPGLSETEKSTVFALARDTLAWAVEGRRGAFDMGRYALTPLLKTPTATFVTLKIRGHLRGCIGSLAPVEPLYQSVHDNAVSAALRDPRFRPVLSNELPSITVDVSILSPIRELASLAGFQVGRHGIILEKAGHRAVYLPEVATEQGWTLEQTLDSLSEKAGLPPKAWKDGARFKVFESAVLSESVRSASHE